MIKKSSTKWKTIKVINESNKEDICFELDENEKLIKKIHNQKRVSNTLKQFPLITKPIDNDLFVVKRKMEISKCTTVFSQESSILQESSKTRSNDNENLTFDENLTDIEQDKDHSISFESLLKYQDYLFF